MELSAALSPAVGKHRVAKRSGSTVAVFTEPDPNPEWLKTTDAAYVSEEYNATK